MVSLRAAEDRGVSRVSWLDSRHTFSFNRYWDPQHVDFHGLRVINEDFIAPGGKFGMHPHENMEIITYVLAGGVEHQDSTGSRGLIQPGDAQRMTAGTGIFHSEANASSTEPLHLYQIWLLPETENLAPGYEQKTFAPAELANRLRPIAAREARDGAVLLRAGSDLYAGILDAGVTVEHPLPPGRAAWVQVARGEVTVNGISASAGDGIALEAEPAVHITAETPAEVLVFDLA